MRTADVLTLFDYVYWGTHRLLDAAEELSPEEFRATSGATSRDLRATLVHELDVEWSWRLRLQDRLDEDEEDLRPEHYPDVATLREHWIRDEAEMRGWLGTLTDDQLAADADAAAVNMRRPLWQYLMHIVVHAAQQQADAATLLTAAGHSPGEIGFLEALSD